MIWRVFTESKDVGVVEASKSTQKTPETFLNGYWHPPIPPYPPMSLVEMTQYPSRLLPSCAKRRVPSS